MISRRHVVTGKPDVRRFLCRRALRRGCATPDGEIPLLDAASPPTWEHVIESRERVLVSLLPKSQS